MEDEVNRRVLACNREAIEMMRSGRPREALHLLKEAQQVLAEANDPLGFQKLQAITLNNLGCYYKRNDRPMHALKYLQMALELEAEPPIDHVNLAATHLNICALRSLLGNHDSALSSARAALETLKQNPDSSTNALVTYCIAYHNAGTELEHLNRLSQAIEAYQVGWNFAKKHLGDVHPMTESLCKSYYHTLETKAEKNHKLHSRTTSGESLDSVRGLDFQQKSPLPDEKVVSKPRRRVENPMKHSFRADAKAHLPSFSERPSDLRSQEVRFITGDRLQPMFNAPSHKHALSDRNEQGKNFRKVFRKVIGKERSRSQIKYPWRLDPRTEIPGFKEKVKGLGGRTKRDKEAAARTIQKWVRMFLCRKRFLRQRAARRKLPPLNSSRKKDQKTTLFPSPSKPKSQLPQLHIPRRNLVVIQACVRGRLERNAIARMKKAATVIQKNVKAHQCRLLFLGIRAAILCIQKWWRRVSRKKGERARRRR